MQSETTRPGGATRPSRRADPADTHCYGILIVYAAGEGCCDLGHNCQAYDLRWSDHAAYLAAHHLSARPGDRTLY